MHENIERYVDDGYNDPQDGDLRDVAEALVAVGRDLVAAIRDVSEAIRRHR